MADDRESQSERYLRAVIERLHKVELRRFDRNGRQRAVDYVFSSPAGVLGAVEMTTFRDRLATEMQSRLGQDRTITCGGLRSWSVTVDPGTRIDELRKRLPYVVAACDRYGVDDPVQLPDSGRCLDVQWLLSARIRLSPVALTGPGAGVAFVHLPPRAGFRRLDGFDKDLELLLADSGVVAKVFKLRDHHDVDERHLAIGVEIYGPGFDLIDELISPKHGRPRYAPKEDFRATHLWIAAGFGPVLTWNRSEGWVWKSIYPT